LLHQLDRRQAVPHSVPFHEGLTARSVFFRRNLANKLKDQE